MTDTKPGPSAAPRPKPRRPVSKTRWQRHAALLDGLERERPLRYLFLEVTRRCNLACAYCGSSCSPKDASHELTMAEWRDLVRQVASDFNPRRVMVAVTGGEPLLREGIFDLFRELRRHGFPYGMVSNGRLLDDAAARELVRAGMGSLSLSMDATPELNDKLRGKGCTLSVGRAIGSLRKAGYRGKLEIITTVTRPVIPLLPQVRRMVAEARVPLWRLGMVMPIGRAAARPDLVPGPDEVRAVLEFIRGCRADGLLPSPEFCEEGYLGDRYEHHVRPFLAQCRAGITTGGILRDGSIGACPELGTAFVQGHVSRDRFRDVWYERYGIFRDRSWARTGACTACDSWERCRGGALHLRERPGAEFLRCLYLMLQESKEGKKAARPRGAGRARKPAAGKRASKTPVAAPR
ncbi:MAG: radical SAM protein [Deltaproteobacteria bacterium]|nr:radical SAM protein [Deltaproteobacteria bacterium]